MAKKRNARHLDAPQLHGDHPRPVTRRDFVARGFISGAAYATSGGILSLFANPRDALAQSNLSQDMQNLLVNPCQIATNGAGKIPFICFDLAGGANIAGSNVLMGREGGQSNFLSTAGYERQGLPGDMIPGLTDPTLGNAPYANFDLGLGFHLDSAFRRGIMDSLIESSMSSARPHRSRMAPMKVKKGIASSSSLESTPPKMRPGMACRKFMSKKPR
jgi:hypothetical protein